MILKTSFRFSLSVLISLYSSKPYSPRRESVQSRVR